MAKQITAATVAVRLTAITGPLQKGLSTAASSVQSFAKSFISLKSVVAGALGVGGVGLAIKNSLDYIDSLSKSAVKFGTTTKAFAGLQHAANLSGVELGSLSTAVKTMQKVISEAASTGKDDGGIFAQMGLSPDALAKMDPVEALSSIADGLGKFQNSAARTAATIKLFGKSGSDLIPLFIGGGDAIREAAIDAEKLGLAIDDVSAIKVEAANDAWTRFKSSLMGAGNTIAVELAPWMKVVSDKLADLVISSGLIGPALQAAFEAAAKAAYTLGVNVELALNNIKPLLKMAGAEGLGVIAAMDEAFQGAKAFVGESLVSAGKWAHDKGQAGEDGPLISSGRALLASASEGAVQVSNTQSRLKEASKSAFADLVGNEMVAQEAVAAFDPWIDSTRKQFDDWSKEVEEAREKWRGVSDTLPEMNTGAPSVADDARSKMDFGKYSGFASGNTRGSIEAVNAINRHMGGGQAQQQTKLLGKIEQGIAEMSRGIDDLRPVYVAFS